MSKKLTDITAITAQQKLACYWVKALATQTHCSMMEALKNFEHHVETAPHLHTGGAEMYFKVQTIYGSTKDAVPEIFGYMLQHAPLLTTTQLLVTQWLFDEAEETDSTAIQAEYVLVYRVSVHDISYPIQRLWHQLTTQEKVEVRNLADDLLKQNQLADELEGGCC